MIDNRHVDWMKRKLGGVFDLSPGEVQQGTWIEGYWYEDAPHHSDYESNGVEYRTVLMDCTVDEPPTIPGWQLIESYPSPGSADCDYGTSLVKSKEAVGDPPGRCPLCEKPVGQYHGTIYLGSGWCENLYEKDN